MVTSSKQNSPFKTITLAGGGTVAGTADASQFLFRTITVCGHLVMGVPTNLSFHTPRLICRVYMTTTLSVREMYFGTVPEPGR
jgi:hypothetical protein